MTPFALSEPASVAEAVALLDAGDPAVRPIAGGTALMLMMKAGVFRPARLISLRGIEARHSAIGASDGGLRIGAMATLTALERSAEVRAIAPVIAQTLRSLSNVRVRNVATLGGHLAHADPYMDLPPVLIALGASVTVLGKRGERTIPVEKLTAGYYETTLARDELITEVIIPAQEGVRTAYVKCTTRAVHDWPALGVAVSLGGDVAPRVVVSAVTDRPMRIVEAEAALGTGRDPGAIARAAEAAAQAVEVASDARGSAAYKRQLVRVYVARALNQALGMGAGS